jgi:hypothetical protein
MTTPWDSSEFSCLILYCHIHTKSLLLSRLAKDYVKLKHLHFDTFFYMTAILEFSSTFNYSVVLSNICIFLN